MSLALYRTYRPGRLSDVVGQEHITQPLSRALANDRVHHAYLFSGPRGCGKTSTARILARSLNCEQGPTPDPCGTCQSCLDLAPNGPGSLDVIELDAASHGGVDDTRDLRERAMFAPASSRYKVYIVDEAHMVTTAGFNALLKLVEEPPEHVRFIFATTEVDKVLPTIRSRTHNYTFRLVPTRVLQEHLARICESEGASADPAALALVARSAGGSVRDALSILGQLLAGSGPDGLTYDDAAAQLGVTDTALVDETVDALAAGDGAALFVVIDKVVDAGHDPRRFATDLLQRLRDLIVLSAVGGERAAELLDVPDAELDAMRQQAGALTLAELSRAADLVSEGLSGLRGATAPRLHLELLAARLLLPASDDSERGIAVRLQRLERGAGEPAARPTPSRAQQAPEAPPSRPSKKADAAHAAPVASPPPPPRISDVAGRAQPHKDADTPTEPEAAASPGSSVSLADVKTMWPAILEGVKSLRRVSWMVFTDSTPLSLESGVLAVGVPDASKAKNAVSSGHDKLLREAIIAVMHADLRVDVVTSGQSGTPSPAPVDVPSIEDESVGDMSAEDLAMRELGATVIGEIEQG